MDLGQWAVIGLSVAIGVWFIAGYLINRRRAEAIFGWLRLGLAQFGELSVTERAGRPANAFLMAVGHPVSPFERVEAVFLLEPRENPPLWVTYHLQGRRDEVIVRFFTRPHPEDDIEAGRPENQEFRKLAAAGQKTPYQLLPGPQGFEIAHQGRLKPEMVERLNTFLEQYGSSIVRLSIHRKKPHLFLRAKLPGLLPCDPQAVFADLRRLVR